MSVFGGGVLMWLICPSPIVFLRFYLRFLTRFVVFWEGVGGGIELVMSWPVLFFVIVCFLYIDMVLLCSLVLCGLYLFFH